MWHYELASPLLLAALVVGAIALSLLVRSRRTGAAAPVCKVFFYAAMTGLGAATLAALAAGSWLWLALGTTLTIMTITATIESGRTRHSSAF